MQEGRKRESAAYAARPVVIASSFARGQVSAAVRAGRTGHSRGEQTLRYATPNDRDLKDVINRSGGV